MLWHPGLHILHSSGEALNWSWLLADRRFRPRPTITFDRESAVHGQDHPRESRHRRLRTRRLHGRDLCRPRHAGSGPDPGHPARRPAHHHHRRRELPGLRRGHPGPVADGADAEAGRARRHQGHHRSCEQGRPRAPAVPARMRFRRPLSGGQPDHRDRRAGALAGASLRAEVQGLRRLRLRHLRRLLLSQQGSHRHRRRQHRGRGGAVPHQLRLQGHGGAPARRLPCREDPAGPPVQEPEDLGDLGHACSRRWRAPRTR